MLVEFASAVDAVTFAVGTRAARCLRFCETDPSCDGYFFIWKRLPKLLNSYGRLELFSKGALKSLDNLVDLDSAIRKFDPSAPARRAAGPGTLNCHSGAGTMHGRKNGAIELLPLRHQRNASPSRHP
ncbi:hypothetical protein [Bradyrhizobium sp. RDI18]|uniref:hypothetical protein n=1 Tax=Bradyrhizobium sp. RDI18 TaxID=3367400 RepID=UPI00371A5F0E